MKLRNVNFLASFFMKLNMDIITKKQKDLFEDDGSQLHLDESILLSKCMNSFFIVFA